MALQVILTAIKAWCFLKVGLYCALWPAIEYEFVVAKACHTKMFGSKERFM